MSSSSSSSALRVQQLGPVGPNVGVLAEQALKTDALKQGASLQVLNPTTDNFPFLLEQSGARDLGGFTKIWCSKSSMGKTNSYSNLSDYVTRPTDSKEQIKHTELLGKFNLLSTRYASLRELLAVFESRKVELLALLRKGGRLIALGRDILNPYDASCICIEHGRLVLKKILIDGDTVWLPRDLFVIRTQAPTR